MRHYDPWWHVTPERHLSEEEIIDQTNTLFRRWVSIYFTDISREVLDFIQHTHISINNALNGRSRISLWDSYVMGSLIYSNARRCRNANKFTYLETGTAFGGSAIFARKILDYADKPKQTVITIDPFGNPDFMSGNTPTEKMFRENMEKCNVRRIKLMVGSSQDPNILHDIKTHEKNYSLHTVFIDGDHTYMGAKSDWLTYNPMVKVNGHIIFHDYKMLPTPDTNYGIKRAVNEIENDKWEHMGHAQPANMYVMRKLQ